ncbi:ribokinase [Mollisia scopiformis]|uniref:Ribokinase n=1 Tax=Mollisia scopiformis TaxID=149040 RepID=A0A194XL32_MOLSC|nr:ribokinase [Mollisia scopiformis]KUJ20804.1 ribokinase [Mollisia scopiformis]
MSADPEPLPLPVIAVIGSLNADLTTYTSRIPSGGETLHANSFKVGSGGKGGNQTCACAKLSRTSKDIQNGSAIIKIFGAVGNDAHGSMILHDLQASGVDTSGVSMKDGVETGVAVILVEEESGENRILLSAGANYSLQPSQFSLLPLPLPSLIILQLEIPVPTTLEILRTARTQNMEVLLNPAPAIPLPEEAYVGLAHLVVNETEAVILSGCSPGDIEDEKKLPDVARIFHGRGVKNVIITLGGRGVFFSSGEGNNGLLKARKVEVVDTTAAGDTFVGAYALEVVKGEFDIKSAVERANMAAAKTIGKRGAQSSIPWADELDSS